MNEEDWKIVQTYIGLIVKGFEQRMTEELLTVVEVMHDFMIQAISKETKEYDQ